MSIQKKLHLAIVILLDAVGLVFLGISIFGNEPGTKYLAIGLCCITAGNLFNLIQTWNRKKEKKNDEK